jgi:hypothetical protein
VPQNHKNQLIESRQSWRQLIVVTSRSTADAAAGTLSLRGS